MARVQTLRHTAGALADVIADVTEYKPKTDTEAEQKALALDALQTASGLISRIKAKAKLDSVDTKSRATSLVEPLGKSPDNAENESQSSPQA